MFIRTKDYVYEPITDINSKSYNFKAKFYDSYVIVSKSTIVKPGNTIEELCDEFVVIEYDNMTVHTVKHSLADAKDIFDNEKDMFPDLKIELKGAIWTDKGLIYVAKMNDKGELELL